MHRFDVPQRLSITTAYDLPFGRDRRYGTSWSRPLNLLAGGWTMSAFAVFQAGFPLAFNLATATAGANSSRPNVVGDPAQGVTGSITSRLNHYFNTAAFAQPPDYTYGNASPYIGTVRSPGMNNIDGTLQKDFHVTEKARVQFRFTVFNVPNHPVFAAPNTTFGNANFGKILAQANFNRQLEFALKFIF